MAIRIIATDKKAQESLRRIRRAFEAKQHDAVLNRVSMRGFANLIRATPKGYTGNTRQSWSVVPVPGFGYNIINTSKVMLYLEEGTKDHGPVTAKALYIPLNRSAAMNGWNERLVYGEDYVLAGRVKGIRAMNIVDSERQNIRVMLRHEMVRFLNGLINTG